MIDLTPVLNAFIILISAVLTAFFVPWIKANTTKQQREDIEAWVKIAVRAAEQIYNTSGKGAEKKEYVLNFLAEKGYKINADDINILIESAVKELNIVLKG